jgi:hypothetical protein
MPVARMLTPFAVAVEVPPIAPDVSDTYVRPADQETLSHTVPATSPVFRRTDDRTKVSFEWVVAWDVVKARERMGPWRMTLEDAVRGGQR